MNIITELTKEIARIVKCEQDMLSTLPSGNDQLVLDFMKYEMHTTIIPILKKNWDAAQQYREIRDVENERLFAIMDYENTALKNAFENNNYIHVRIMSSIAAQLNLTDESDIDFGICVTGLNDPTGELNKEKFNAAKQQLEKLGYVKGMDFNVEHAENRYFSFEKQIDKVEIEGKVRDEQTTQIFLDLHERLDNHLSDEQITLYTYAKHILIPHKESYKHFKKILYESVFADVTGGFVFPMP